MTSVIKNVYGSLQEELKRAKEDLKGVEENIKKIIGRDPNEGPPNRLMLKRTVSMVDSSDKEIETGTTWRPNQGDNNFIGRGRKVTTYRNWQDLNVKTNTNKDDERPIKRRLGEPKTVFSRLSGPPRISRNESSGEDNTISSLKPVLSSQVIVTPREIPSRKEVLAAQGSDESSKARNRRMFGALLGTLQKFRQEETKLKGREEKKAQVEKKLEEAAIREKEELKRERQELFQNRKRRQADIRNIELKMLRIQEQEEWEKSNKHLLNFIQTKAKPHIFYLPKKHIKKTEEALLASQSVIGKMIEKKRAEVQDEVAAILRRNKTQNEEMEIDNGQEESVDKENQEVTTDLIVPKVEDIKQEIENVNDLKPAIKEEVVSDIRVPNDSAESEIPV
uniref:Pinin n=1 Tax=Clastoptera arizonana TaxID=38151 RepID=A0A1B6D1H6_9HEMI